jgi:hypothetical protein
MGVLIRVVGLDAKEECSMEESQHEESFAVQTQETC